MEEVIHPVLQLGRRGLCFHFYYVSISDLMFFREKAIFFHRPVQTFKKDSAVAKLLGMFEKMVTNLFFSKPCSSAKGALFIPGHQIISDAEVTDSVSRQNGQ